MPWPFSPGRNRWRLPTQAEADEAKSRNKKTFKTFIVVGAYGVAYCRLKLDAKEM
jgi:hypothetical protein